MTTLRDIELQLAYNRAFIGLLAMLMWGGWTIFFLYLWYIADGIFNVEIFMPIFCILILFQLKNRLTEDLEKTRKYERKTRKSTKRKRK